MIDSPSTGSELTVTDAVFTAVADEQRRAVLRVLADRGESTISFETLVDQVVDQSHPDGERLPDDTHRQRVRIALHHVHLPRLQECGLVCYDEDAMAVRNSSGGFSQGLRTLLALSD